MNSSDHAPHFSEWNRAATPAERAGAATVARDRAPRVERWASVVDAAFTDVEHAPHDARDRGLLALVAPLVDRARRSWREEAVHAFGRTRLVRADVDSLGASLARALDARVLRILRPTLALELQVARLRTHDTSASPAARFDAFVARIAEPTAALALLREYPVLARQVTTLIDAWLAGSIEMISRLVTDTSALLRARLLPLGGALVAADIGRGDTHRGGRSVTVLTWDDGSKLVYKPRSLAVDVHFGELLSWVNGHHIVPELRAPRVNDCGTHGWMEFVEARACTDADEVARFYARQGALLALAHVLDGVDLHGENVIACGEHPMLIDLEALLHPRVEESERSAGAALSSMRDSVLRVGLLPEPSSDGGYDGSGLGSGEGMWKVAMPVWSGHGTDELRVKREWVPASPTAHRPMLDGHPVSALTHRATLTRSFNATLSLVARERTMLLAPGGPIARFARDEVRAILRPTELYGLLLRETFHPDLLRDATDRDRAFDRLSLGTEGQPWLARAMDAERADLWRGDIPYFTVYASSRDLVTSTGELVERFFPESAMTSVARKIEALDDDERARQGWFVDSALTALGSAGDAERLRAKVYAPTAAETADTDASLVSTACVLGDRLATLALRRGSDVDWLGLAFRNERWEVMPVGASLADGKLGIALFLAMLGRAASEPSYTRLAEAALASALRDARMSPHTAPRWART
jgi:type 2 lantibiotic biosynthesis protein LanM